MKNVHIGNVIKKIVRERRLTDNEIAEKLNKTRSAVQAIYSRPNINSGDLAKFSEILNYDFFKHFISDDISSTQEPNAPNYGNSSQKKSGIVSIVVELDGSDECIKKNISMLSEINNVVRKQAT